MHSSYCNFYGPSSGVRLTALGDRNKEATQASKLVVPAFAVISHSGHGVKQEQQLGQVVILYLWTSVNILDEMLFPKH